MREFADLGIPVLGNGTGRGLVPEDDQIGFSWPFAQRAAALADCVIVVGEMLTQRLGFGLSPRFAVDARFIQLDVSADAFHRNRPIDVALLGKPGPTLAALRKKIATSWDPAWLSAALSDKAAFIEDRSTRTGQDIHPLTLGKALQEQIAADAMLVGDGADIQNWMYSVLRVARSGGFMDHYPLGAMGSGTALAVGAAAALAETARAEGVPPPATVLVTGDGSIGFHPAELHAAALAGLNLKIIVGNDSAWGTEAHSQMEALGRTINTQLGTLPYASLAIGFGLVGLECNRRDELDACIAQLLSSDGPALLDVRIDQTAGAELKTNPLASSILFSDLAAGQSAFGAET